MSATAGAPSVSERLPELPPGPTELTAFVREVVLPAAPGRVPALDARRCRFALVLGPSPIHRWGVFAAERVPARRRVIEYTGERITPYEVWRRRVRPNLYIFWLGARWALDGAVGGSGAELVNHSCEPNLRARVARGRIFLVSVRPIAAGEELTLDYHLRGDYPDVPCACGAPSCRGLVNVRAGTGEGGPG